MTQSDKMTTCISTYNSLPFLKLAIHSVRKNEHFNSPMIIFADGCTDGTDEWLWDNREKYNYKVITAPRCEDSSNGYGMNVCAAAVETPLINFLHADMYCAKDFDLALLNKYNTYNDTDRVLISSYRIQPNVFHNGEEPSRPGTIMVPEHEYGAMPEYFNEELFLRATEVFCAEHKDFSVAKAEGCSFLISKADWDFIGGNDLRFKPNGYDDMDLFLRMRQAGYKYCTIGGSVVYHFAGRGGNGFFGKGLGERNETNQIGENLSGNAFFAKWGGVPVQDEWHMVEKIIPFSELNLQ